LENARFSNCFEGYVFHPPVKLIRQIGLPFAVYQYLLNMRDKMLLLFLYCYPPQRKGLWLK
jgi:hypothetical protein